MPITVDASSWTSAIRADDKPVYLNREGTVKTGVSLKGRLVGIAESLGIFKDYVVAYREREVVQNRDAYDATWRFVNRNYGIAVGHYTRESIAGKGYTPPNSIAYVQRLQGHNAHDPQRAVVGRELRLILDTARGAEQAMQKEITTRQPADNTADIADRLAETKASAESGSLPANDIHALARPVPAVTKSVTSPPESPPESLPEAAAVATPARLKSLPKPQSYKGVDYFDQSDKGVIRLGIAVRNHQGAKQVVSDDAYLVASVPEDRSAGELTSAHREYIKTTLLRHVAEHERSSPGTLLGDKDLHRMMMPITARALEIQSGRKLRAKVLYKNVVKNLGRKDTAFGDALKKMRRDARIEAGSKAGLLSFVRDAARKANVDIKIDNQVFKAIRPQVKDMAEAYVDEHRRAITKADLEHIVQVVLRGYSIAVRMGQVS